MTLSEMHAWFRQYAQQMGMQNTRAILPEQIDSLINTATLDIVDEVINLGIGSTNDRVITDNSKIANINALRTLYRVYEADLKEREDIVKGAVSAYANNAITFTSKDVVRDGETPLYFVDFAISYIGYSAEPTSTTTSSRSRWFPIRIVDDSYLADILNDWILAPRMRTPVMVCYGIPQKVAKRDDSGKIVKDNDNDVMEYDYDATYDVSFELYLGENNFEGISKIAESNTINSIRCSYIAKPRKVVYKSDISSDEKNIESDLPEQLHIPMLKHAVDLYRISVQGSIFASQQNAQMQQQEAT